MHIVDGTQEEALLAELFSNEGVGTMIHADDYQQIREARMSDVPVLLSMMQQSVDDAALVPRSREQVQQNIHDFFVLEMDGNPIGSVAVHDYDEDGQKVAEIACLFVKRSHKNKGHGQKLVTYAEETARKRGCARICALSTQAFRFFEEKLGYTESDVSSLPAPRRERHSQSGRNSKVLTKPL